MLAWQNMMMRFVLMSKNHLKTHTCDNHIALFHTLQLHVKKMNISTTCLPFWKRKR